MVEIRKIERLGFTSLKPKEYPVRSCTWRWWMMGLVEDFKRDVKGMLKEGRRRKEEED
jgi:hypothetical protein